MIACCQHQPPISTVWRLRRVCAIGAIWLLSAIAQVRDVAAQSVQDPVSGVRAKQYIDRRHAALLSAADSPRGLVFPLHGYGLGYVARKTELELLDDMGAPIAEVWGFDDGINEATRDYKYARQFLGRNLAMQRLIAAGRRSPEALGADILDRMDALVLQAIAAKYEDGVVTLGTHYCPYSAALFGANGPEHAQFKCCAGIGIGLMVLANMPGDEFFCALEAVAAVPVDNRKVRGPVVPLDYLVFLADCAIHRVDESPELKEQCGRYIEKHLKLTGSAEIGGGAIREFPRWNAIVDAHSMLDLVAADGTRAGPPVSSGRIKVLAVPETVPIRGELSMTAKESIVDNIGMLCREIVRVRMPGRALLSTVIPEVIAAHAEAAPALASLVTRDEELLALERKLEEVKRQAVALGRERLQRCDDWMNQKDDYARLQERFTDVKDEQRAFAEGRVTLTVERRRELKQQQKELWRSICDRSRELNREMRREAWYTQMMNDRWAAWCAAEDVFKTYYRVLDRKLSARPDAAVAYARYMKAVVPINARRVQPLDEVLMYQPWPNAIRPYRQAHFEHE